jgi:putative DNA methylase
MIEVALPLEAINVASAKEKSIRHGHPSTLHLWWARRPLAACRAVLFGSLVDDPSSWPERFPTEEAQEVERQRLFRIIEELVKWENSTNDLVLGAARAEIARSIAWNKGDKVPKDTKSIQEYLNKNAPPVLDPFCGGGSIPLEAQRLGLEAHGSDLNPVAVLISKALIEIPPRFAGRPPVNPESRKKLDHSGSWRGAQGLADDVRYYGKWMRDEAERRIGHLYPKAKLPDGKDTTVIAWLWARTVKCPNPACGALMPLLGTFQLSTRKGKEAWIDPVIDRRARTVRFEVKGGKGKAPPSPKVGRGATFICLVCETIADDASTRNEFKAKRNGKQLTAIVAEGERGRVYLTPDAEHERIAALAVPLWKPEEEMDQDTNNLVSGRGYGITNWFELFTPRQLVTLTTFSDLVNEARQKAFSDARIAQMIDDNVTFDQGGANATAYGDAVATYLGLGVSKLADYNSSFVIWSPTRDQAKATFARQAIPMVWDFVEVNSFAKAAGDLEITLNGITEVLSRGVPAAYAGEVTQLDATALDDSKARLVSTDPPYYDNIGYAELSDFFYVWLRRSLGKIYPTLCSTLLVPKKQELVATPHRFNGDREKAKTFFEEGLGAVFTKLRLTQIPDYPLTVYYAFKQAEDEDDGRGGSTITASTGWETMLEGLVRAGFSVTGTWPVRTERGARSISIGTNALASSIVLVCRRRTESASLATRREFLNALKDELPDALKNLQHGNIAPVDLAQAAIGPGMAVFSRYSKVVESDGSPMRVRTALQLINQALDEVLAEQESEYDRETRFAVAWFEQFGVNEGPYGVAEVLATAKATAVSAMVDAGIVSSGRGSVRLLRRDELPDEWDPASDNRLTVWEVAQHLIRALDTGGEAAAAGLFTKVGGLAEVARDLAYRLYTTSERKGWTQEALAYNSLVVAWPEIKRLAARPVTKPSDRLFER